MKSKDTLEKAYGSIPKEIGNPFNLNWIPEVRSAKYYYVKLVRFFTR